MRINEMKNNIAQLGIALLIVLVLHLFSGPAAADDWPHWRGPHRNGVSNETDWNPHALSNGPNIAWTTNVGEGYSAVSVQDGRIYTMGNTDDKDIVYCLDTATGKEIWRFAYDYPVKNWHGPFATPAIDGDRVYTISRKGDLYCLDAKTGEKKWFVNLTEKFEAPKPKYGFSGSPVIEGNLLILNAGRNGLALDKLTGEKIWGVGIGKCGYATPVIYTYQNKKYAAVFSHRRINGVDIETGERVWHFPWKFYDGADSPDPVVVGNRVFVSTAYRNGATMIEFTPGNKKPKQHWFRKDLQNEFGSSIYLDGRLYVPHGDTRHSTAYLKCIDFNTGKEIWSRDTGHCSLILADGKFIVLNQWGELTVMEASERGYKDIATAKVVETSSKVRCWTAPVLANGKIYIRTNTGTLVCVDIS